MPQVSASTRHLRLTLAIAVVCLLAGQSSAVVHLWHTSGGFVRLHAQERTPGSLPSSAESSFLDGLAALHSFEYEEANAAFLRAQAGAPESALAYWGEAMTYHQTLWGHEDVAAGRRALARYGPTAAARARRAATDRERALLEAVDALFGEGESATRRRRYADRMAAVQAADPNDREVAALYALALLGTMSRSLIGYVDSHEGHSASLAGSGVQTKVGEILGAVLRRHPTHPGALHYLIHNYDDPAHARLALEAARAYATVAPESSHARHMPAHIFLQLGMWAEAEASDRAAYAASEAWVVRKGLPAAMKSYHALQWHQYELLQLGRVREAAALIDVLAPVVAEAKSLGLLSDLASMRARQVVESRQWARMATERNFANVNELCAIGLSAARSGNAALAELAREQLAARATAPEEGDLRPAIAIMEREVAGVAALTSGRTGEALAILEAASAAERRLPPPLGLPIPLVPAPELLGEALLEAGRPDGAVEAFSQALSRNANRTRSVLGMARALAKRGDFLGARTSYAQVLVNYANADPDLPELAEARAALDAGPPSTAPVPAAFGTAVPSGALAAVGVVVAGAGVLYWRRRRTHRPVAAAPSSAPRRHRPPRRGRKT